MKMLPIAAAALLTLSGCAAPFNASVSRFQSLPAPSGQTFVIQSDDPRLQGGIEFGQYAALVSNRLTEAGYRPATEAARADLVVKMDYHVDSGHERVVSTPDPFGYGSAAFGRPFGYGFGYRHFGYRHHGYRHRGFVRGFYDPFLYDDFGGVSSYTVYNSELDLRIDRTETGERVFEGSAKAQSADNALPHIVPNLVEAMFTGFPGNSGETVKITITPERKS